MRLVALIFCIAATTGCQNGKFMRYSAVCSPNAGAPGMPGGACEPGQTGGAPGCGPGGMPGGPSGPGVCQPGPGGYPPGPGGYQPGVCRPGPGGCQPGPEVCKPGPQVKAPPPTVKAPPEEVTETKRTATAIAPDILLIPRTVLVPYQPHVPTGPVRLQGALPSVTTVHQEERVTTPKAEAPAPKVEAPVPDKVNEGLDECLKQLKMLNCRITDIEARTCAPAYVPPAPCPPLRGPVRQFFGGGAYSPAAPGVYPPGNTYPPIPDGLLLPAPRPLTSTPVGPMIQPLPEK